MSPDRQSRGMQILSKLTGLEQYPHFEGIRKFYPDFADHMVQNGFADIYGRPGLDMKQRSLITLSSLISQGSFEQLEFHIPAALNVGLTPAEIKELVLHCTAYAGFPKAVSALNMVMKVFKERGIEL